MSLRIALLTPRRRFIANRFGLGYQIPLGMVLLGGPLLDAGHHVRLIDNDVLGMDDERLARHLATDPPDCVMLGHTGSTAAHPTAMRTASVLRKHLPRTALIYGGVYPSYAANDVLRDNPAIDMIVRGEGEETAVVLAAALERRCGALADVRGLTWRDGDSIRTNPSRPPIADLDRYRPGWELVDWDAYQLFGFGRAAGIQFSRGCTLACTYCGQWNFWRRWRHRSPQDFVDQLELLAHGYGVRIVWFADENFAADPALTRAVLVLIAARKLDLSLNLNMTAADVVRDAELLRLYKRAGVDNIVMGVESLDDAVVARVGKNNPRDLSQRAVALLHEHDIVSLVNVIYGLEDESRATVARTLRRVFALDADVLNAVYLTPHFWTPDGRRTRPVDIINPDLSQWTYRNQVINTPRLAPWQLLLAVKLTEALFHLRPRALWRMLAGHDKNYKRILRAYLFTGVRVVLAEIGEFLFRTRFVRAGSLAHVPGFPHKIDLRQRSALKPEKSLELRRTTIPRLQSTQCNSPVSQRPVAGH